MGFASKRVLIVDADASVRVILAAALEAEGYATTTCDTTLRIVHEVKEHPPDLVLVEHAMPGFTGTHAIRLLRQMMESHALPAVPLVLMSTDAPASLLSDAREQGATAYVDKGIGPDGICGAVSTILGQGLRASA